MEESRPVSTAPNVDYSASSAGEGTAMVAVLCLLVGAAFMGIGLFTTFTYDDSSKLVGGDAFNFQILATRGLVFVCTGVGFIVAAVANVIFSLRAYLRARFPIEPRSPAG
jgi:hypothetical protein